MPFLRQNKSPNKVITNHTNLKDIKTLKQYNNVLLPILTRCKNSTGLYLGPKTKMFFPLRATPLNTRANATNVSWQFSSCGPGLGATLSTCCSSPARSKRVMSTQNALSSLGGAWKQKGQDRNNTYLAQFQERSTRNKKSIDKSYNYS